MLGAAWWMCALLALSGAGARVYERCELARDLRGLGVRADHVATWVCIAFHESRFDTAARNTNSGDHGLLQISELYWCGAGKACGLACEALRDEDIADDVQCALLVHEEHTRLQGDGFLAWVVYPQHCKHNTKKYLADCDETSKDASTIKPFNKSRALNALSKTNFTLELNPKIDELRPPYMSLTSNTGHRRNELEFENKSYRSKWQVTHFSNIDELSLPVFRQKSEKATESSTKTSTATTTNIQPFKNLKRLETNQFRNKIATDILAGTTIYESSTKKKVVSSSTRSYTQAPAGSTTHAHSSAATTTTQTPSVATTKLYQNSFFTNPQSFYLSNSRPTSSPQDKDSPKQSRFRCLGCRAPPDKPTSSSITSTPKIATILIPNKAIPVRKYEADTSMFATTTRSITTTTSTTVRNRTTFYDNTNLLTITTPNFITSRSRSTAPSTILTRSKIATLNNNSARSTTPKIAITPSKTTTQTSTFKIYSGTPRHWRTLTSEATRTAVANSEMAQSSQRNAIFDLYLNTKKPKLTTYKFVPRDNSVYKRRIFADGTTSPATPWKIRDLTVDRDKVNRTFAKSQT